MVLVPVLYNNNPNTFNTYISSRPGNQPSSTHIRATMFSTGKHPPNHAPARLFSRPRKTPTNRADHQPRICAVIFSSGETLINRSHSVAVSGLREPPKWETPYTTYTSSLFYCPYGLSFPARVGMPLLVGGSNPLSGL